MNVLHVRNNSEKISFIKTGYKQSSNGNEENLICINEIYPSLQYEKRLSQVL